MVPPDSVSPIERELPAHPFAVATASRYRSYEALYASVAGAAVGAASADPDERSIGC